MTARARRWNHNLDYHPLILDAVPEGCQRALDVGCGAGILAHPPGPPARWRRRHRRPGGRLPHLPVRAGLVRPHRLGRGAVPHGRAWPFLGCGVSCVLGGGWPSSGSPAAATRPTCHAMAPPPSRTCCIGRPKGYWEISSPIVWPPPETYAGMRRLAAELLPCVPTGVTCCGATPWSGPNRQREAASIGASLPGSRHPARARPAGRHVSSLVAEADRYAYEPRRSGTQLVGDQPGMGTCRMIGGTGVSRWSRGARPRRRAARWWQRCARSPRRNAGPPRRGARPPRRSAGR
jgi:hypothetical protein